MAIGIDLPRDVGTRRLPWQRLLRFIEYLADSSAVARARRDFRPTIDTLLARRTEYNTHLGWWLQLDKKGQAAAGRPELIPLHGDDKGGGRSQMEVSAILTQRQAKRRAELARLEAHGGEGD